LLHKISQHKIVAAALPVGIDYSYTEKTVNDRLADKCGFKKSQPPYWHNCHFDPCCGPAGVFLPLSLFNMKQYLKVKQG
jgi:hypothetical protein